MNTYEKIQEWKKGCSCATNEPYDCKGCTLELIKSIEDYHKPKCLPDNFVERILLRHFFEKKI